MLEQEIFETYADNAFDKATRDNSITWKREWYNANFKKFFPENKNAKLLDIGPGLGELLTTEKEWGYEEAMAIDISPSTTEYCNERGMKCVCVGDTTQWLREHSEVYDVITLLDVFEHIPQKDSIDFLRACKVALKQNGILILQVPNIQSAESFLHRYNDITHVFGYSQHTLEQLVSVVQFKTVRFYPFEEYPGDSEDRKNIRRLRSIYWKMVSANREITHNLNPQIMTPELFAVLSKGELVLPENAIDGQFEDCQITLDDVKHYLDKAGIRNAEDFCEMGRKIDGMSKEIFNLKKENINLKNDLDSLKEELEKSIEWIQHIVEDQRAQEQGFNSKLDEQNGRLVKFVDEKVQRLDEHNEWTRKRLDNLEKFKNKLIHPFKK